MADEDRRRANGARFSRAICRHRRAGDRRRPVHSGDDMEPGCVDARCWTVRTWDSPETGRRPPDEITSPRRRRPFPLRAAAGVDMGGAMATILLSVLATYFAIGLAYAIRVGLRDGFPETDAWNFCLSAGVAWFAWPLFAWREWRGR